ncbi:hypothetical protein [Actinomadura luteofluorescens]
MAPQPTQCWRAGAAMEVPAEWAERTLAVSAAAPVALGLGGTPSS